MTLLRLLGPQGVAGLVVALLLGAMLAAARIDSRHWKKQSARFEQLYRGEVSAHAGTVAAVRAAAERAAQSDRVNAARVRAEQDKISERIDDVLQTRLADARARARRLREPTPAAAPRRASRGPPLPGLSQPAADASPSAGADRLSDSERLLATEQAIQLDELIKWVQAQAAVEVASEPQDR